MNIKKQRKKKSKLDKLKIDCIKYLIEFFIGWSLFFTIGFPARLWDNRFIPILTSGISIYLILSGMVDFILTCRLIAKEKQKQSNEKIMNSLTDEFKNIKLLMPTELMRNLLQDAEVEAKRNQEKIEIKISFFDDSNEKVTKTIFFDEEYASTYILEIEK